MQTVCYVCKKLYDDKEDSLRNRDDGNCLRQLQFGGGAPKSLCPACGNMAYIMYKLVTEENKKIVPKYYNYEEDV